MGGLPEGRNHSQDALVQDLRSYAGKVAQLFDGGDVKGFLLLEMVEWRSGGLFTRARNRRRWTGCDFTVISGINPMGDEITWGSVDDLAELLAGVRQSTFKLGGTRYSLRWLPEDEAARVRTYINS